MASPLNLNIYNILIIAGSIQGLIFSAFVLINPKYKSNSNFYLSLLIITISLNNLYYWFIDVNYIENLEIYRFFYIPWALLIVPMYYYFVDSYLQNTKVKVKIIDYLLCPFYVFLIFHIIISIYKFFFHINNKTYLFYVEKLYFFEEYFSSVFTLFVIYIIYKKIKTYEKENFTYNNKRVTIETKWLKKILLFGVLICFVWVVLILYNNINSLTLFSNKNRYFLWISNSALIYYLGYLGIYYNGIFKQRNEIRKNNKLVKKKIFIQKNKVENIKNDISNKKIFLDPNLSLQLVAKKYSLNESYLSQIFNKESEINFPTFINKLRVEESKKLLINTNYKAYDIISIALEAGFNSKSVFYNAFKKETGLTPTQYRKQNLS